MAQQESVYNKHKEEELENLKLPTDIYQDSDGRIRDKEGNIINLNKMQVSTQNINKNKFRESRIKELLKYQRAFKPESVKDNFNFDSSLKIVSKSRESRINAAFHFIEKGSIVGQQDGGDGEVKRDENGEIIKVIPAGVKRVGLKVKHHDPIPDFEWWDVQFIAKNEKGEKNHNYLPEDAISEVQSNFLDWDQAKIEAEVLEQTQNENPDAMDLELTEDQKNKISEEKQTKIQALQENPYYFHSLLNVVKNHSFNEKFIYQVIKEKDLDIDPSIFIPSTTEAPIQTPLTEKEKKKTPKRASYRIPKRDPRENQIWVSATTTTKGENVKFYENYEQ